MARLSLSGDLDSQTRRIAEFLANACRAAGLDAVGVCPSGNVVDGPGWTFRATSRGGVTFDVEVAGPPYESNASAGGASPGYESHRG